MLGTAKWIKVNNDGFGDHNDKNFNLVCYLVCASIEMVYYLFSFVQSFSYPSRF